MTPRIFSIAFMLSSFLTSSWQDKIPVGYSTKTKLILLDLLYLPTPSQDSTYQEIVEPVVFPTNLLTAIHWPGVSVFWNTPPLSLGFLRLNVKVVLLVKLLSLPNQTLNLVLHLFSHDSCGNELLLVGDILGFVVG